MAICLGKSTVCVLHGRLSTCRGASLPFGSEGWMCDLIVSLGL